MHGKKHLGGWGQKIMCVHRDAYHEHENRSPLRPGSTLETLGDFDALSCYLSLIFKYSDTKLDLKT